MIMSFCDFNFIMKHFKFLKTVGGKGLFNLFCASLFLVGNDGNLWGYIFTGCLAGLGLFFMLVGCACIKTYEDKNLSKEDLLKKTMQEKEPLTAGDKEGV